MDIFQWLCCACNTQQEKLLNIHTGEVKGLTILQMLEYCTQNPVDKLSQNICYDCIKQLEISYHFLKRYNLSQRELKVVHDHIRDQQSTSNEENKMEYFRVEEDILEEFVRCDQDDISSENENLKYNNTLPHMAISTISKEVPHTRLSCRLCKKSFLTGKALQLHTKIYHKTNEITITQNN